MASALTLLMLNVLKGAGILQFMIFLHVILIKENIFNKNHDIITDFGSQRFPWVCDIYGNAFRSSFTLSRLYLLGFLEGLP